MIVYRFEFESDPAACRSFADDAEATAFIECIAIHYPDAVRWERLGEFTRNKAGNLVEVNRKFNPFTSATIYADVRVRSYYAKLGK